MSRRYEEKIEDQNEIIRTEKEKSEGLLLNILPEQVAEELSRFLRGEPIVARPIGHLTHLMRWANRNRATAALGTALMAAVIFALAPPSIWRTVFSGPSLI